MIFLIWTLGIMAVVALPVVGSTAVWWGFTYHPVLTTILLIVFVVGLLIAAASYERMFPG